jgi:hypothetical protein
VIRRRAFALTCAILATAYAPSAVLAVPAAAHPTAAPDRASGAAASASGTTVHASGTAGEPNAAGIPANAQTAAVRRYVDAIAARRYADAYALLEPGARAYFRTAANYASIFVADGFALNRYRLIASSGDDRFRVYFVHERIRLIDPARDAAGGATITVPYGVAGNGAGARIKDLGHPWRATALRVVQFTGGVRVTVKKIAYYAHAIDVVLTVANLGDGFVTLLPYGRSALRDDGGGVYRLIEQRDAGLTGSPFELGVRLAPNAQITGVLSFGSTRLNDGARRFRLTFGPVLRDGAPAPFSIDIADIVVA